MNLDVTMLTKLYARGVGISLLGRSKRRDVSLVRIGRMRHPFGRLAGCSLLQHTVNLLERQTLGLGNQEVGEEDARSARSTPDEEDLRLEIAILGIDHVGSDEADDKVPQPVRCCRERDALGADGQREDLADDNPCGRTPGRGKEEDVDAREDDEARGRRLATLVDGANDGDDELADEHTDSTVDEEHTAAELLDGPEGEGCRANVDGSRDHGDGESVVKPNSLEEGGAVVEDGRKVSMRVMCPVGYTH